MAVGGEKKASNVHDPVTTTKALFLFITAPRKFSAPKKTPTTASNSTANSVSEADTKQANSSSHGDPKSLLTKQKSVSGDSLLGETPPPVPEAEALEEAEFSEGITLEETAAVTVEATAPEDGGDVIQEMAIINVEELLRISFHKLAEEWHLLNIPTYAIVNRLSKVEVIEDESESLNFRIEVKEEEAEATDWIQVTVMVRPPSLEIVLDRLERIGVGTNLGTVTVINSELCRTASPLAHDPPVDETKEEQVVASSHGKTTSMEITETAAKERALEAARAEWKNAATRVRIEQVREQILEQSAFSFDFISLLIVASILAGIGLVTNNTVVIVASMLVSPIMGPVLGVTFGTRVRDWPLVWTSLWHETLALGICVIIGVMVGLLSAFSVLSREWPTNEMQIRGEYAGLVTGLAIALPSGMGVCLSILGGNTSSLVGVAISASLLPPAVNAGVCLVYSLMLKARIFTESEADAGEFAIIGGISFTLTVLNILCIWVAGLLMFGIKEVTPTVAKNAFWARDIKVAREMNRTNSISRPINADLIREGIQAANKKDSQKKFKLRFNPKTDKPISNNNLDTAFAISPHVPRNSWRKSQILLNEEADPEADGEDTQFIGLEDMGRLLGFNREDADEDGKEPSDQFQWNRFFPFK